jgi:hypothetical protein
VKTLEELRPGKAARVESRDSIEVRS